MLAFSFGRRPVAWLLLALALAALLLPTSLASEEIAVLRASVSPDATPLAQRLAKLAEDQAGRPVQVRVRQVSGAGAVAQELSQSPRTIDFGMAAQPVSFPNIIHIPVGWGTISVYANVPGTRGTLNMTACLVAKVFTGQITTWSAPELKDVNPTLAIATKDAPIVAFAQGPADPATVGFLAYLAAACPGGGAYKFSTSVIQSSSILRDLAGTGYSIGYDLTSRGASSGLQEVAIQNKAGVLMTANKANTTDTAAALTALMPAAFAQSFAGVATLDMAGATIFPMTYALYMYLPADVSSWSDLGPVMQALARLAVSKDGQALVKQAGLQPFGHNSTVASRANAALDGMKLAAGQAAYGLEPSGTYTAAGGTAAGMSGNRAALDSVAIADLSTQVAELRESITRSAVRVLRGSGSSAVSIVMWKLMDQFTASSSTPVWLTYRAIGSGNGENEFVGANNGFKPYVHFGCSDVPLKTANWKLLRNQGIKVVHVPIGLAPMSFFVNLPHDMAKSLADKGGLKLSACTVAKLFSGVVTSWADPAVTADNSSPLPDQPVTFYYRSSSSGTTSVITEYLSRACPEAWTFGSGSTISQWPTIANGIGTTSNVDLGNKLQNQTYSIGYMEAGIGQSLQGLLEVSLRNKEGTWLTSAQADVPAAALQLFASGGWPADPADDFSAISLLDQPGAMTWPIVSMPMMFVRTDNVDAADSGPLLSAFISYLLLPSTQAQLTQLGFSPMPDDVLSYTQSRAVPIILSNPKYKQWSYEAKPSPFSAAGDSVLTDQALKSTYTTYSLAAINQALPSLRAGASASLEGADLTQLLNGSSAVLGNSSTVLQMQQDIRDLEDRVQTLLAVAAAGVVFGIVGCVFAFFATCKVFIQTAIAPGRMAEGNMSVRRKSFAGSEGFDPKFETSSIRGGSSDGAVPPIGDKGV